MDGRAPIADTYILVCISLQLIHPLASRFLLQYGHAKLLHYACDEVSMDDTKSSRCGPSLLEIALVIVEISSAPASLPNIRERRFSWLEDVIRTFMHMSNILLMDHEGEIISVWKRNGKSTNRSFHASCLRKSTLIPLLRYWRSYLNLFLLRESHPS